MSKSVQGEEYLEYSFEWKGRRELWELEGRRGGERVGVGLQVGTFIGDSLTRDGTSIPEVWSPERGQ